MHRADLAPEFDVTTLNAKSLLQSKPFLTMVLMVAILDPPREEAVEAIKIAHTAGITVKMITGGMQHACERAWHGVGNSAQCIHSVLCTCWMGHLKVKMAFVVMPSGYRTTSRSCHLENQAPAQLERCCSNL